MPVDRREYLELDVLKASSPTNLIFIYTLIITDSILKAVHTKERTFQCPSCPRAFATSWQAKSHIKNNHGQKKSYKCQKCTRSGFKTPQALAGHVKSFHMTKVKVLFPYLSALDFLSISNLNFASYTGSKNQVQTRQKNQVPPT